MTDFLTTFRTRLLHAEALVELARSQRGLADAGDYDGLIESLERKGRVIDRMAAACDESLRDAWVAERDTLPDAVRQECEMLLDKAEQHLDETLSHERDAIAVVTASRETVNADLQNLSASRRSQAGYADQIDSPQRSLLDLSR